MSAAAVVAGTREGASNKLAPGSARGKQVRSSSAAAKAAATKCGIKFVDRDLQTLWWPPSRPHHSYACVPRAEPGARLWDAPSRVTRPLPRRRHAEACWQIARV